jgi:hypothetical protein
MVPTRELTEEEVLGHLRKILKGISVVLHKVDEFIVVNPPPTVSLLLSHIYFSSMFPLLKLDVDLGCLQEWGQNFDGMPPLPSENNPGGVGEGRDQGAFTRAGGSSATVSSRVFLLVNPG